jgi:hypothetical protein
VAYIVMDLDDATVVDEYATEREALEFVHAMLVDHGVHAVAHWAVGPADRSRPPIRGDELIDRARAVPA